VWHGIEGKYGAKTRAMLLEEMVVMEAELANIRKQQKILERNIGLMQPQGLDPDMLSEQAGRILGMMHPDERQYK
jgi:cell division protein FtsB